MYGDVFRSIREFASVLFLLSMRMTPSSFRFVQLASAPVLMGNTCVWKPSSDAVLSNYFILKVLEEAGLPDGVINFVPGDGKIVGDIAFAHPEFAGLHFTGSTRTFNTIWKNIAQNVDVFNTYPRIVGETGGKNFHFIHESAAVATCVHQTIRSAFEYQGKKDRWCFD